MREPHHASTGARDWSVGVDVGGTYTDLAALDPAGAVHARKVLSTPADQSAGVARALEALGTPAPDVGRVVHGTTVVTNLLLERTGARVVLCATEGATDLLELRRQERASLYDLSAHHPPPLVAPDRVVAVRERVGPEGVKRALDDAGAREAAEAAAALAPEIVAVALLHAYADRRHEQRVAAAISARLPDVDVVCSSSVLPEIREYERTATTVAEAYARPAVARYLARLADRLREGGFPAADVMTSGGGVRAAADAARHAASLALSGPAGGVTGAAAAARAAGFDRALTIDIGGTSADVGLVLAGEPLVERGGAVAGVPIALPRVLVETVSAGGGSVLWVDDGGALRAGPRSAGSDPGPASFGRGGSLPTITDAHVVLGNIRPGALSGGVRLDPAAAERAVGVVAARLGTTAARVARAGIDAADAEMARALRRVSVERGVDPRSCVLVAFGGGGPLHACGLAERLSIARVLVPPHAGVLSAVGLALGEERREAICSVVSAAAQLDDGAVRAIAAQLAATAGRGELRRWWARARYEGQGHELEVPFEPGDSGARIAERFTAAHRERSGFALDRPVELVSARHTASRPGRPAAFARRGRARWSAESLRDDGGELDAVVAGPATIALPDATLLVPGGWSARALPTGGWLVERGA